MKKIKIGIDLDEVIRAKWSQFDKYYCEEFGEDNVTEEGNYCLDFFDGYVWEDTVEENKLLNEDIPDDINPKYYHDDENKVNDVLFKTEKNILTAKDVYNRFMYEDFLSEIFGYAKLIKPNIDVKLNEFIRKYEINFNGVELILFSEENKLSIPPTLFFLSKIKVPFNEYKFYNDKNDAINDFDIVITTDPKIIDYEGDNIKVIKIERPYNNETNKNGEIKGLTHIDELISNPEFEKLINYNEINE